MISFLNSSKKFFVPALKFFVGPVMSFTSYPSCFKDAQIILIISGEPAQSMRVTIWATLTFFINGSYNSIPEQFCASGACREHPVFFEKPSELARLVAIP